MELINFFPHFFQGTNTTLSFLSSFFLILFGILFYVGIGISRNQLISLIPHSLIIFDNFREFRIW